MFTAPNIRSPHGFFSRKGGVSCGVYRGLNCGPGSNDDPALVAENRRIVASKIANRRDVPVISAYQEHGNTALFTAHDWGNDRPRGDALVTTHKNLIVGALTADCTPILLEDAEAGVVSAVHAGWRGAVKGITDSAIILMQKHGARLDRISAAIGPTIAPESYEVGADMFENAIKQDSNTAPYFRSGKRADHWQFDLPGYVEARLKSAEITNVWNARIDTYANEEYFSFRRTTHRNEHDYGRMIAAIMPL